MYINGIGFSKREREARERIEEAGTGQLVLEVTNS